MKSKKVESRKKQETRKKQEIGNSMKSEKVGNQKSIKFDNVGNWWEDQLEAWN